MNEQTTKRPRVFIVQEPMKRDPGTGTLVSMLNFARASEYGELIVCLPHGHVALSTAPTVMRLQEVLRDFNDNDYLLCAGDPSAIAIASAIASNNNRGCFNLLKYDRDARSYILVKVDIFGRLGKTRDMDNQAKVA